MKLIVGIILGFILLSTIITNAHAESTDTVWLRKTKRGVDITCPPGFEYYNNLFADAGCVGNVEDFLVMVGYNDLYAEEEFFEKKEILKDAIAFIKTFRGMTITEKKSSKWLGTITVDIKYKTDEKIFGLFRTIVYDDGTMIRLIAKAKYDDYNRLDGLLTANTKVIEPDQVQQLEKTWTMYIPPQNDIASKKAAETEKIKADEQRKQLKVEETKEKIKDEQKKTVERKKLEKQQKKIRKASDDLARFKDFREKHKSSTEQPVQPQVQLVSGNGISVQYKCNGSTVSGIAFYTAGVPVSGAQITLVTKTGSKTYTTDDQGRWAADGIKELTTIKVKAGFQTTSYDAYC